jgi:hypothetical protein
VHVDLEHRGRGDGMALDLAAVHLDRDHGPLGLLEEVVRSAARTGSRSRAAPRPPARRSRPSSCCRSLAPHRPARPALSPRPAPVEARREQREQQPATRAVAQQHAVDGLGVVVQSGSAAGGCAACAAPRRRARRAPAASTGRSTGVVGRALLVERAQRVDEALLALRAPDRRGAPPSSAVEERAAVGQHERDAQLLGHARPRF